MKWVPNKHYRAIALTAFLVIAASMLFYFLLFRTTTLGVVLSKVFSVLSPVIYGFVIAYVLNPVMILAEKGWYMACLRLDRHPGKRMKKAIRVICTFLAVFVLLFLIYGVISSIVPELVHSIRNIIVNFQTYSDNITKFFDDLFKNQPVDETTQQMFDNAVKAVQDWFGRDMAPQMNSLANNLTSGVFNLLSFMKNFVLGLIISVYILIAKENMVARFRRVLFSILPIRTANRILYTLRFADLKFGSFLIGKLIDSMLIGVICYFACFFMRMPYSILIAVVIGVTNIIPFFGPFLGAIPCTILIFVVNPVKSLIFIIFILCLQQFDGNFLGPKILGNSVGVSSYMVILSILIGGGFFGPAGMLFGVPVCAVILSLIETSIMRSAKGKRIPVDLESYHYAKLINPVTKEVVQEFYEYKASGIYASILYRGQELRQFDEPLTKRPWERSYEQIAQEDAEINGEAYPPPEERQAAGTDRAADEPKTKEAPAGDGPDRKDM